MHTDVRDFALHAAPSLEAVLDLLAAEPGRHTLLAGGTELMVALNTGRLETRSLVSIQHLQALRFIRAEEDALHIGGGTTFTDLSRSLEVGQSCPLLSQAASWTGSIANQNRGTLGGNICNASPAADTPPALLVYDAKVVLISKRGSRTLPYRDFHLGYKKTALQPDELLHSIVVPRSFGNWQHYIRKVGTRQAQAISKIALAAVAQIEGDRIAELRLAGASLADRPLRLSQTEEVLRGASIHADRIEESVRLGRLALFAEAAPIDDIRSTARYREAVAANLLEQFLRDLRARASSD